MKTAAAYVGATFSLLGTAVAAACCVWSVASGFPALLDVASGGIAVIMGYMVVKDWPTVWRPLLTGK
jgi:hypothetical protein